MTAASSAGAQALARLGEEPGGALVVSLQSPREGSRFAPVILDPGHSEMLYVGSEGGGGVFKSTDGGDTWSAVNVGLTDKSVLGLAADPRLPRILYVAGPHGVFATTTGGE